MTKRTYLTPEGHQKLTEELAELKGPGRRKIAKDLATARAHGDLKENAEYDAAKDAQAHLEKRISELENSLANAQVIDKSQLESDTVTIAKTVTLKDLDSEEEIVYRLVAAEEADPVNGKISVISPIGKALIGRKVQEKVDITIPAGTLRYQILKMNA